MSLSVVFLLCALIAAKTIAQASESGGSSFQNYARAVKNFNAAMPVTPSDCGASGASHLCFADNFPFLKIHGHPVARSILMIHGLGDSPYSMLSLAGIFYNSGYNVVGILLPGHGTNQKDLLDVTSKQWQDAMNSGLVTAGALGDYVSIAGFSTGGALTLYALRRNYESAHPLNIQDIFLFSPAIQLANPKVPVVCNLPSWALQDYEKKRPWAETAPENAKNKYRYVSIALNAACQLQKLIEDNSAAGPYKTFSISVTPPFSFPAVSVPVPPLVQSLPQLNEPIIHIAPEITGDISNNKIGVFTVESDADTTVNPKAVIEFMQEVSSITRAKFILYPKEDGIPHAAVTRPETNPHFSELRDALIDFIRVKNAPVKTAHRVFNAQKAAQSPLLQSGASPWGGS